MIFHLQPIDKAKELTGKFYVIDAFPYPQFVIDENGDVKSFDIYEDAFSEAGECQDGYVISI